MLRRHRVAPAAHGGQLHQQDLPPPPLPPALTAIMIWRGYANNNNMHATGQRKRPTIILKTTHNNDDHWVGVVVAIQLVWGGHAARVGCHATIVPLRQQ
jgi:hypothetical protein